MGNTAQVIKLPGHKPAKSPRSKSFLKRMRRQGTAACAIGGVSATLVALSLSHLAHGIAIVTAAPEWESWAMATGIDLGFVALEGAQVMASTPALRNQVGKFAKPAIVGTLTGSAAMNAFAFASAATGWYVYAAVVLGLCIPALIYALTRIGAAMYIDCHTKG